MIEKLIGELEFRFNLLDASINRKLQIKIGQFNKRYVTNSIQTAFGLNRFLIISSLNEMRDELLDNFKNNVHLNLKKLESSKHFKSNFLLFIPKSDQLIKRLGQCLIGNLYYRNDFDLLKKFKYLNLFDRLTNEVRHFQQQDVQVVTHRFCNLTDNSSKVAIISGYHLLVYVQPNKEEAYLKIINEQLEELHVLPLDTKLHLKDIICFGNKIVALFLNRVTKSHQLYSYGNHLEKLAFDTFDFNVKLLSLTETEVLCWSSERQELITLDYNLVKRKTYGQLLDANKPFYFGNGTLIDINESFILLYNLNSDELDELDYGTITGDKELHYIKILNRQTGLGVGEIKFEYEYFTRLLKLDKNDRIIFKPFLPDNIIECFQINGQKISDFTSFHFRDIDSLRLTENNQIVFHNRSENKIEII